MKYTIKQKKYELMPTEEQGIKSFGRKAVVVVEDDGSETLFSYDTPIIQKMSDGTLIKFWNDWSNTTGKHIKAFCGLNKKEYIALSNEVKE